MKSLKFIIYLLCFCLIANNVSFSQSSKNQNIIGKDYKEVTESLQLNRSSNDINNISFYFCNSGLEFKKLTTYLEINVKPGEIREICTIFANKVDEKFEIIEGFTNGNIEKSNNKIDNILCDTDIIGKNRFSKLIENDYNYYLSLSGKELKIKKISIKIPLNQTGSIYLCRMFKISGNTQKAKSGSMFNIEVVKKMPIKINIIGESNYLLTTKNNQNILKLFAIIIGLGFLIYIIQSIKKKHHHK